MPRTPGTRRPLKVDLQDDASGVSYRDVIFLCLAGIVAILIMVLPHIQPKGEKQARVAACPQGEMIVEVQWAPDIDADVDLWVRAPGDVPVGYSNKGGVVFNLLRDDLGKRGDYGPANVEMSVARFAPPGTYTVNVHLYRNPSRILPMNGKVQISTCSVANSATGRMSMKAILMQPFALAREGQEATVLAFDIDEELKVVPGSVNNVPVPLRSTKRSSSGGL